MWKINCIMNNIINVSLPELRNKLDNKGYVYSNIGNLTFIFKIWLRKNELDNIFPKIMISLMDEIK